MLGVGHDVSSLVRNGSEEKVQDATRVQIVPGDIASKASLRELIKGCDAVIYNVGILRESPRQGVTFEATQYEGVVNTVDAALDVRVRRFLLMSANGVKVPGTTYQETKFRAEEYALRSGLDVTVFRPSVIFGDPHGKMEFATQLFREMVRPPVPAVSFFSGRDPKQGAVVMSPVHITDVAAAFLVALENVDSSAASGLCRCRSA
jgi:NADH dehydrogenase